MRYQLQQHIMITLWAKQGVFAKAFTETLSKRFRWQYAVTSGVIGHVGRYHIGQLFSHLLVAYITMQSVISDSLKALWQNMLYHWSNEFDGRECLVFDLTCFMVPIPV